MFTKLDDIDATGAGIDASELDLEQHNEKTEAPSDNPSIPGRDNKGAINCAGRFCLRGSKRKRRCRQKWWGTLMQGSVSLLFHKVSTSRERSSFDVRVLVVLDIIQVKFVWTRRLDHSFL